MKKELFREFEFENREGEKSTTYDLRMPGTKNLFNFLSSELEEELGEQIIQVVDMDGKEITSFSKEDYERENVDLTLKQLNRNVYSSKICEKYFVTYMTQIKENKLGERKEIKVAVNNLISKSLVIVLE